MTHGAGVTVSHLGMCVSDLDRSLRFYCDGLGFTGAERHAIGNEFADALEVPRDVVLASQFIRREGLSIELLRFASPAVHGRPSESRNQLGLTHLSFVVEDLDRVVDRLVECGGTLLRSTIAHQEGIRLLFIADPDGVRVELMEMLL
jgi:catechol 2,3-dioxygenase-like lactoylglutathione lyase family enzyme